MYKLRKLQASHHKMKTENIFTITGGVVKDEPPPSDGKM